MVSQHLLGLVNFIYVEKGFFEKDFVQILNYLKLSS